MPAFNLRVYGILLNGNKDLLVSDELIKGEYFTKFPGGGLEFGEGTRDCLAREFLEEMNLHVSVEDHLYTTDYFQLSAFHHHQQIISIYYIVKALEPITVEIKNSPFAFTETQMATYKETNQVESFRFIRWKELSPDAVTLPIDKKVVQLLKDKF